MEDYEVGESQAGGSQGPFNTSLGIVGCDEPPFKGALLATAWFQAIIYFLYSSIFLTALLGNGLVCYVVYSSPRMRTVTNYFIANLAVGDILMTLFCVPTSFVSTLILQYWPFGPELCPGVNYSQAVSVLVSAYTLVAISVDRYTAIMWPLKPRMTKRQAKIVILSVWLVALATASPIAAVSRLVQPAEQFVKCGRYICHEDWPTNDYRYYYSMALLVMQYLIPLLVLMFTYTSIAVVVWGKQIPGEAENTRDQRMARSKRKMVKMMMTVVIVFTICWLPFNVLTLALDHDDRLRVWSGLPYLWAALHWLSMSHSCYNPVIYCWMNARFRAGFLLTLARVPYMQRIIPQGRRRTHHTSMAGIALTGLEAPDNSILRRINTCSTYISVRRKPSGHHYAPARSASLRHTDLISSRSGQTQSRRLIRLDSHPEERI
ncbi:RYamide receptor isoform X1 [Diprion similis]|uniref:RYamide receptor isoform X1 n=1 Tax=Diprion similis TaxID=362088 RepID=UPI001EF7CBA7|nr:RYamide receptor isoform X1 [Diprion similis]XP_046743807.1 RYamide receptor isoform X1 [Diprion similis]XP_046743809.1 RYamide receptor isoform X1 [Diprion similis]